jgi:NAD(P)-dependent dehydrogenase (short-subunit alcohol dehydrogenase family)
MHDTTTSLTSLMKPGFTAVVTGASSGIGRAACLAFAKAGMNVWLLDIDAEELMLAQRLVKEVAHKQPEQVILAEVIDVANAEAMELLADQVFKNFQACHILMNNAGIQMSEGVGAAAPDMAVVRRMMDVNVYGPMHGCLSFISKMKTTGQPGIIINTGSKQGITMPPGNLIYNMSKCALKCYTEGLEHELMLDRLDGKGKLRAALLVPGWVNTSIVLKSQRAKALQKGEKYDPSTAFFHEDNPHSGAWMPSQVITFMQAELDLGKFYIICPDNEIDRATDNLRMSWTMNDIIQDRPPLSRWHPDYKEHYAKVLEEKNL